MLRNRYCDLEKCPARSSAQKREKTPPKWPELDHNHIAVILGAALAALRAGLYYLDCRSGARALRRGSDSILAFIPISLFLLYLLGLAFSGGADRAIVR